MLALPSFGRKDIKLSAAEIKKERSVSYVPQAYYEEGSLSLYSACLLYNVQISIVNTNTNEIVYQGHVTIARGTQINIQLNLPLGYYQLNLAAENHSYSGEFIIDSQDIQ